MFKFAGKDLPDYVTVSNITYSILPTVDHKTQSVYGRAGAYDFGIELGQRKIEMEVQLLGDSQFDIIRKARDFSNWLYYKDLQPLILNDEPDKQYMARLVGDTEVSELFRIGKATITFVCPSPYAESLNEVTISASPTDETPISIYNNGSAETFPVIELTMKQDTPSIAVIADDKFVLMGENENTEKNNRDINPTVLNDDMSSFSGWTSALSVDGGEIAGTFSSNGFSISQAGKDYGDGSSIGNKWHGASAIKSLSRPVQDFTVETLFGFDSSKIDQVGRLEVYLLDDNNTQIGKIAVMDYDLSGEYPQVEARAGSLSSGNYFVREFGSKKGTYANMEFGMMKIYRYGKKWGAYFCKIDSKGTHNTRLEIPFYDHKGLFTEKLAKIQIHIGSKFTHEPVSNMYITNIKVDEETMDLAENEVPVRFKKGDKVTIDNNKAIVLRGGKPAFEILDPASDFFGLDRGANGLIISPPVADVNITYRERWL